jgi:hypothetical protein
MAASSKKSTQGKSHTLSTEGRNRIDDSKFAFPKERKEPLENASHVRNAIARFNQVQDVSPSERKTAASRIKSAAKKFGVKTSPTSSVAKKTGAKKSAAKKTAKKAAKKTA